MLFSSWENLGRVLVTGILAYIGLVTLIRATGKRMLSKLSAFDLVVTVALGSTLASTLLPPTTTLADGLLAFALLISAKYAIAWLQVRSSGFRRLVKSEPTLLFHCGEYLDDAMKRERVARDEILAAARAHGVASVDDIYAVVLETDGTLSVLKTPPKTGVATIPLVVGDEP